MALEGHRVLMFWSTLLLGLVVLAGLGVLLWRIYRGPDRPTAADTVSLAEVLSAVKREIRAAETAGSFGALPLSSVSLELHVLTQVDSKGSLKPSLLSLGAFSALEATGETLRTQKVAVVLEPPAPDLTQGAIDLSDLGLAAAIENVRQELKKGIDEPPRLDPKHLEIEIVFGAKRSQESSGGIKLEVVEAGASQKYLAESTQKITLKFGAPKKEEEKPLSWD